MKNVLVICLFLLASSVSGQTLPDFRFVTGDGFVVDKNMLVKGKPVMVVYFDPFCDHCEELAIKMKNYFEDLRKINLVMVSWESHEENEIFREKFFKGLESIIVCKDVEYKIDNWFGLSEVPSIYCYNSTWNLTATYRAIKPVREMLEALKK